MSGWHWNKGDMGSKPIENQLCLMQDYYGALKTGFWDGSCWKDEKGEIVSLEWVYSWRMIRDYEETTRVRLDFDNLQSDAKGS